MKLIITESQLQKVITETMDDSKSQAVKFSDMSSLKFSTLKSKGLKAYILNKEAVELIPIENFKDIPKFDSNNRSWSANTLLLLTNEEFNLFNRLTTKVKELIELEEKKLKLLKEQVQAIIYERLKK